MKKLLPIILSASLLVGCRSTPTNTAITNSGAKISTSSIETISNLSSTNSSFSNSFSIVLDGKEKNFDLTNTGVKVDFGKVIEMRDFPSGNPYSGNEYTLLANLSSREKKLLSQEYNIISGEKLIQPNDGSSSYFLVFSNNFDNLTSPAEGRQISGDIIAGITPVYIENFEGGTLEASLESGMCEITTLDVIYQKNNKTYDFRYNNIPCVGMENAKKIIEEIKSIIKTIK